MVNQKSGSKLIIYALLIIILMYGLVKIFSNAGGRFLPLELFGFIFLAILTVIGFIDYSKNWGERVIFFVFTLYIANLAFIWYYNGSLYFTLLFFAIIGFLLSVPKKVSFTEDKEEESTKEPIEDKVIDEEPHSMVFDKQNQEPEVNKAPATKTISKKTTKKTTAKHSPGKYLASISSNVYHEPKCEWAKRIAKKRRVWFNSKEDAWEKGYKGHSCVE